jgi:hypothetical protein
MKKYTKIVLVIVCIIIILSSAYYKTVSLKEGLTNKNSVILLGDSILNNSKYVSEGKSVYDNLKRKTENVYNFAKDGATINDLYSQLDNISLDLNKSNTYIFVSAGGNDILNKLTKLDSEGINKLFNSYMKFIKSLKVKMGSVRINILNLYLPSAPRYKSYELVIKEWNKLLNDNSNKIGEMYNVVDIYSLLNSVEDFVYNIEPSEIGSVKIADAIYYSA